jgi:hypothetical protein
VKLNPIESPEGEVQSVARQFQVKFRGIVDNIADSRAEKRFKN